MYILHVGTNDLSLDDTPEAISKRIIANVESLEKEHNEVAISNIVARGDDLKEKGKNCQQYTDELMQKKKHPYY